MQSLSAQATVEVSGGGCSWSISYEDIISLENLLGAWEEFVKGKHKRKDVQTFGRYLMDNVIVLHRDLVSDSYRHGGYEYFRINDSKPRDIHKASVRDRLLHHALYRKLYPFFDQTFIFDSYSCRDGKGTHKALNQFRVYATRVSGINAKTVWVLKCDIRKFFASIDQGILIDIMQNFIQDGRIVALINNIVKSFDSGIKGKGLPLGNLTSQLLVNIYMNRFDQFIKKTLKVQYYIRYSDDFVILSHDKNHLLKILPYMVVFLRNTLQLEMHPHKVSISTFSSGIDFLGWIHFPDHRVLRTTTKRRMLHTIQTSGGKLEVLNSYLGMLSHGNARKLSQEIMLAFPSGFGKVAG